MKYRHSNFEDFFSSKEICIFMNLWLKNAMRLKTSEAMLDEISKKIFDTQAHWRTLFFWNEAYEVLSRYLDYLTAMHYKFLMSSNVKSNLEYNINISYLESEKVINKFNLPENFHLMKTNEKIVKLVQSRLFLFNQKEIYKHQSLKATWNTVDLIWKLIGHHDIDLKFYSKRLILSIVHEKIVRYYLNHSKFETEQQLIKTIDKIHYYIHTLRKKFIC